MRWARRLRALILLLILSAFTAYWSILYIRPYKGVIGNLCKVTAENPYGDCYDMLPSGGFPFTFMWDAGYTSVVGKLSMIEDTFGLLPYLGNFVFYLVIYAILFGVLARRKTRPK